MQRLFSLSMPFSHFVRNTALLSLASLNRPEFVGDRQLK